MPQPGWGTGRVPLAMPFGRLARDGGTPRGVLLSAAVHSITLLVLLWGSTRLIVADRSSALGRGAGGGGGNRAFVLSLPAAALPAPPARVTVPSLATVVVPALRLPALDLAPIPLPPLGGLGSGAGNGEGAERGPGGGSGSGLGSGGGVGSGNGADSGSGGRAFYPPSPKAVIIPPQRNRVPGALHGDTIVARFEISARGEVMRVGLYPAVRDRRFANEFIANLRDYAFVPARTRAGLPIASELAVTIILP